MKNKTFIISNTCIAALVCASFALAAETKSTASPAASASPPAKTEASTAKARPIPFHGMVSAVDQTAKTFTIAGKDKSRVFKVTEKTVVTKAGKSATMVEIVENVEVSGSYWKEADGTLEAKTVKVGPMGEKKATESGKKEKASTSTTGAAASASPSASPKASPKKP